MIRVVVLSSFVSKQLCKLPLYIVIKFQDWIDDIEKRGLQEVRKVVGYHDEPLKGKLSGYRSIRLSKGYRAYYKIVQKEIKFVFVERIDKHEY